MVSWLQSGSIAIYNQSTQEIRVYPHGSSMIFFHLKMIPSVVRSVSLIFDTIQTEKFMIRASKINTSESLLLRK